MACTSSVVWDYFDILSNDKAKCKICRGDYSRKGGVTSSLRNHLKIKHVDEFKQMCEIEEVRKTRKRKASPTPLVKAKQATLEMCFESKKNMECERC